jgi:hypothetical protein
MLSIKKRNKKIKKNQLSGYIFLYVYNYKDILFLYFIICL